MSSLDVAIMTAQVEDYFKNVTDEQLEQDLIEAGFYKYNTPEYDFPILGGDA